MVARQISFNVLKFVRGLSPLGLLFLFLFWNLWMVCHHLAGCVARQCAAIWKECGRNLVEDRNQKWWESTAMAASKKIKTETENLKKKKNNNISVFSSNVTKAEHLELSFTVLSASSESLWDILCFHIFENEYWKLLEEEEKNIEVKKWYILYKFPQILKDLWNLRGCWRRRRQWRRPEFRSVLLGWVSLAQLGTGSRAE